MPEPRECGQLGGWIDQLIEISALAAAASAVWDAAMREKGNLCTRFLSINLQPPTARRAGLSALGAMTMPNRVHALPWPKRANRRGLGAYEAQEEQVPARSPRRP